MKRLLARWRIGWAWRRGGKWHYRMPGLYLPAGWTFYLPLPGKRRVPFRVFRYTLLDDTLTTRKGRSGMSKIPDFWGVPEIVWIIIIFVISAVLGLLAWGHTGPYHPGYLPL